jgi:2-polyprenyl-3-methyl-5-hydroxy-6-metoxy-1,4-benzoquinol methylase
MSNTYHFQYSPINVYGHVVDLVLELGTKPGVHLDIGCGFGAIAEPLRDHGLTYVGFDQDGDGLADLRGRGFESHAIDLSESDRLAKRLNEVVDADSVVSISLIDVLEHITDNRGVLKALRRFIEGRPIPLIISVPNVAHHDIAFKLLTGRWEYIETGLLDRTHVVHHTADLLSRIMVSTGWRMVATNDLSLEKSDQAFPADSVVLNPATSLNRFLRQIRDHSDPLARVYQLVRAYLPGAQRDECITVVRETPPHPFLTVVLRTQGRRPATLRDAFLCLQGQSCADFEVLVLAHRVDVEQQLVVERVIEDLPQSLKTRTRLIVVDHGTRAAPLNVAVQRARGSYVSFLDDDDLVFSHWVETFQTLSKTSMGRVLRSIALRQEIEAQMWSDGTPGYRTVGSLRRIYPSEYDLLAHLSQNFTPFMCLSFPRQLFRELGVRFDESLDICEDWDFEMRAVLLCGVAASPEFTAIYREWKSGHSSYTAHSYNEWRDNEDRVISNLDAQPHIFPPGTIRRIRDQQAWIRHLEADNAALKTAVAVAAIKPLRHQVVDQLNRVVKAIPLIHRVLRACLSIFEKTPST